MLIGAVHETGHALYEQGRNLSPEWKDLPVNTVSVYEAAACGRTASITCLSFAGNALPPICAPYR